MLGNFDVFNFQIFILANLKLNVFTFGGAKRCGSDSNLRSGVIFFFFFPFAYLTRELKGEGMIAGYSDREYKYFPMGMNAFELLWCYLTLLLL